MSMLYLKLTRESLSDTLRRMSVRCFFGNIAITSFFSLRIITVLESMTCNSLVLLAPR